MLKLGRAYRHNKSSNLVVTQEPCTIRLNGKKIAGIIYHDDQANNHVRAIDDFISQCTLIDC